MSVYLQDPDVTILQGDAPELLRTLPDGSVHMACTSPPFYGLRDYGTGAWEGGDPDCDHKKWVASKQDDPRIRSSTLQSNKKTPGLSAGTLAHMEQQGLAAVYQDICGKCGATRIDQQIGLETTPDEWVARLVDVFRELRRVLRDDGQLWIEVGDSYASAFSCARRNIIGEGSPAPDVERPNRLTGDLKEKDLIGAPWLLAFALRADGWYLRSEIIWAKPNPMPESVSDRPTVSHSRVFLLTKQPRYFYDSEAIREDALNAGKVVTLDPKSLSKGQAAGIGAAPSGNGLADSVVVAAGRNRRSVWTIPTEPYPEAHFATWPTRLVEPMILAGTSERGVCPECGAPWERIIEGAKYEPEVVEAGVRNVDASRGDKVRKLDGKSPEWLAAAASRVTTGWQPTCTHYDVLRDSRLPPSARDPNGWDTVPATILDPFGGAGTTAVVARKLGRRAILLELNPEYCALAARRLAQQSLFAGEHV